MHTCFSTELIRGYIKDYQTVDNLSPMDIKYPFSQYKVALLIIFSVSRAQYASDEEGSILNTAKKCIFHYGCWESNMRIYKAIENFWMNNNYPLLSRSNILNATSKLDSGILSSVTKKMYLLKTNESHLSDAGRFQF